tara:strand:+ start:169 stop:336 length:168 start_codon:yes stop_codon:yes gene_type:complete
MKKYEKEISQDWLYEKHTESNCRCGQPKGTATLRMEGCGDIEVCLECFGADGCVY